MFLKLKYDLNYIAGFCHFHFLGPCSQSEMLILLINLYRKDMDTFSISPINLQSLSWWHGCECFLCGLWSIFLLVWPFMLGMFLFVLIAWVILFHYAALFPFICMICLFKDILWYILIWIRLFSNMYTFKFCPNNVQGLTLCHGC